MQIDTLCKDAHRYATEAGLWDGPRNQGHELARIMRELAEAIDALEDGSPRELGKELADVVVFIGSFSEHYQIDLPDYIDLVMAQLKRMAERKRILNHVKA